MKIGKNTLFFIRISKNRLSLKCSWGFGILIFLDVLKFLLKKSLNALCSYFFLETMAKILIFSLNLSHNYPKRHRDSIFLFNLLKNTLYFFILGKKTLKENSLLFYTIFTTLYKNTLFYTSV